LKKSKITASAISRSVVSRGSGNDLNSNKETSTASLNNNRLSKKILKYHYQTTKTPGNVRSNEILPTSSMAKSVESNHM